MDSHLKVTRVLLVDANDMTKWVGSGIPFEVHVPPLGLMYLAAYGRTVAPQVEFRILESSLHCPGDDQFTRILNDFKPDLVGIRSIVFFLEELQRIAALTRAHSGATIVVGGPIVQACKDTLLALVPQMDIAVKGEGERPFGRILSGVPVSDVHGILFRREGTMVENEDSPEIEDLDRVPFPAYDLVDLGLYERQLSYSYNHRRQGILLTSRGCVYHCTFCFNHWKKARLRSADNVFQEIDELYRRYDIRDFYIIDDIFNVDVKRALSVFEKIIASNLELRLYFANGLRADTVTEQFVDKAIEAGAVWFTYALESANEEIQRLVNKNVNLTKARHIISYTQKQGVVVNISTMFGFPTETSAQAQQTLDWLGELPKPSLLPYHFNLRIFPGCEINGQALAAGWEPARLDFSSQFSYNDLPMGTPTLPRSEMFRILLEYHNRFGLNNRAAVGTAVKTLQSVGYGDSEITHMYSVLKRKIIHGVDELIPADLK
jgi:anaerobic magnesium-protoporphyrin IX monomethyl ester cyclase